MAINATSDIALCLWRNHAIIRMKHNYIHSQQLYLGTPFMIRSSPSSAISSKALSDLFSRTDIPLALTSAVFSDAPLMMVNDAFLRLTGYTRDEVIGRNCRFLQGPESEPEARRKLRDAIDSRTETFVCIKNYRKDGTPFKNYVFLRPIFSIDGKLMYILGSQFGSHIAESVEDALQHAEVLEEQIEAVQDALKDEGLVMLSKISCSSAVMRALVDGSP